MAYSADLRRKVIEFLDAGESVPAVARRLGIGVDAVREYRSRRERFGEPVRFKTGPKRPVKLTPADDATMLALIEADPGITLNAIRAKLSVEVAESTVCRRLQKLGISLKKSR